MNDNTPMLTDLDIFVNGVQFHGLTQAGPSEADPYVGMAMLAVSCGNSVEMRFSNPEVFALASMVLGMVEGLTITLKSERLDA